MKTIVLRNNSAETLRIMLEPWATYYDIPTGSEVDIECPLEEGAVDFEINFEDGNFLALWVPFETKIKVNGEIQQPLKDV